MSDSAEILCTQGQYRLPMSPRGCSHKSKTHIMHVSIGKESGERIHIM